MTKLGADSLRTQGELENLTPENKELIVKISSALTLDDLALMREDTREYVNVNSWSKASVAETIIEKYNLNDLSLFELVGVVKKLIKGHVMNFTDIPLAIKDGVVIAAKALGVELGASDTNMIMHELVSTFIKEKAISFETATEKLSDFSDATPKMITNLMDVALSNVSSEMNYITKNKKSKINLMQITLQKLAALDLNFNLNDNPAQIEILNSVFIKIIVNTAALYDEFLHAKTDDSLQVYENVSELLVSMYTNALRANETTFANQLATIPLVVSVSMQKYYNRPNKRIDQSKLFTLSAVESVMQFYDTENSELLRPVIEKLFDQLLMFASFHKVINKDDIIDPFEEDINNIVQVIDSQIIDSDDYIAKIANMLNDSKLEDVLRQSKDMVNEEVGLQISNSVESVIMLLMNFVPAQQAQRIILDSGLVSVENNNSQIEAVGSLKMVVDAVSVKPTDSGLAAESQTSSNLSIIVSKLCSALEKMNADVDEATLADYINNKMQEAKDTEGPIKDMDEDGFIQKYDFNKLLQRLEELKEANGALTIMMTENALLEAVNIEDFETLMEVLNMDNSNEAEKMKKALAELAALNVSVAVSGKVEGFITELNNHCDIQLNTMQMTQAVSQFAIESEDSMTVVIDRIGENGRVLTSEFNDESRIIALQDSILTLTFDKNASQYNMKYDITAQTLISAFTGSTIRNFDQKSIETDRNGAVKLNAPTIELMLSDNETKQLDEIKEDDKALHAA